MELNNLNIVKSIPHTTQLGQFQIKFTDNEQNGIDLFNIPELTMTMTISYDLTPYLLDTKYKYYLGTKGISEITEEDYNHLTDISAGNCGNNQQTLIPLLTQDLNQTCLTDLYVKSKSLYVNQIIWLTNIPDLKFITNDYYFAKAIGAIPGVPVIAIELEQPEQVLDQNGNTLTFTHQMQFPKYLFMHFFRQFLCRCDDINDLHIINDQPLNLLIKQTFDADPGGRCIIPSKSMEIPVFRLKQGLNLQFLDENIQPIVFDRKFTVQIQLVSSQKYLEKQQLKLEKTLEYQNEIEQQKQQKEQEKKEKEQQEQLQKQQEQEEKVQQEKELNYQKKQFVDQVHQSQQVTSQLKCNKQQLDNQMVNIPRINELEDQEFQTLLDAYKQSTQNNYVKEYDEACNIAILGVNQLKSTEEVQYNYQRFQDISNKAQKQLNQEIGILQAIFDRINHLNNKKQRQELYNKMSQESQGIKDTISQSTSQEDLISKFTDLNQAVQNYSNIIKQNQTKMSKQNQQQFQDLLQQLTQQNNNQLAFNKDTVQKFGDLIKQVKEDNSQTSKFLEKLQKEYKNDITKALADQNSQLTETQKEIIKQIGEELKNNNKFDLDSFVKNQQNLLSNLDQSHSDIENKILEYIKQIQEKQDPTEPINKLIQSQETNIKTLVTYCNGLLDNTQNKYQQLIELLGQNSMGQNQLLQQLQQLFNSGNFNQQTVQRLLQQIISNQKSLTEQQRQDQDQLIGTLNFNTKLLTAPANEKSEMQQIANEILELTDQNQDVKYLVTQNNEANNKIEQWINNQEKFHLQPQEIFFENHNTIQQLQDYLNFLYNQESNYNAYNTLLNLQNSIQDKLTRYGFTPQPGTTIEQVANNILFNIALSTLMNDKDRYTTIQQNKDSIQNKFDYLQKLIYSSEAARKLLNLNSIEQDQTQNFFRQFQNLMSQHQNDLDNLTEQRYQQMFIQELEQNVNTYLNDPNNNVDFSKQYQNIPNFIDKQRQLIYTVSQAIALQRIENNKKNNLVTYEPPKPQENLLDYIQQQNTQIQQQPQQPVYNEYKMNQVVGRGISNEDRQLQFPISVDDQNKRVYQYVNGTKKEIFPDQNGKYQIPYSYNEYQQRKYRKEHGEPNIKLAHYYSYDTLLNSYNKQKNQNNIDQMYQQ